MALIGVQKCAILFYLIVDVFRGLDGKQFPCKNGKLINPTLFCDGGNHCGDGSDESYGCDRTRCGREKFACSNLQCLPLSVRCDRKLDCDDGSDEVYCDEGYFQCKNGQFINSHWFCDGENDCFDGSDESYGCSRSCGRKKFACTNGQCLPIEVRCDGKPNCGDKSDEMNCEHVLSLQNCTQRDGRYLCKDGLQCIPFDRVCDVNKRYYCNDFSDIHENCFVSSKVCDFECPHPCWRSPDGPQCFCGATHSSHHTECNKVADCDPPEDKCDQLCVKYRGMIRCSCNEGYNQPNISNGICVNEVPQENTLLYSNRQGIFGYSLTTRQQIFVENRINVTCISAAYNYVYWSETLNKTTKIFRKIPKETTEELIHSMKSNGIFSITSIAVDWIGNNTYFTSQNSLLVCNNNGSTCSMLKNSIFGIESVALLPRKGLMFWIQNSEDKYNNASILVSSMDGSDELVLVGNVHLLNHLVVDESSEKIYWLDIGTSTIESMKYNGKRRKIVIPAAQNVFSFSVFEGKLYLALRYNNGIFQGRNHSVWLRGDNIVNEIHIYNPRLQNTRISNPCASVFCNGLCLLRSASPLPGLKYTCLQSVETETLIGNGVPEIITQDHSKYGHTTFESIGKIIIILIALGGMLWVILMLYLRQNKRRSNNQQIFETEDMINLE